MGATVIVTDSTFDAEVLNSEKPVVVDFWAEWCGPCKLVAPILEEIAGANPQIKIVKLNVDENPVQAAAARVTSIPTMNVYVKGQLVKQIIGAKPKAALLADLAAYL
jgi:thioredoxin 1